MKHVKMEPAQGTREITQRRRTSQRSPSIPATTQPTPFASLAIPSPSIVANRDDSAQTRYRVCMVSEAGAASTHVVDVIQRVHIVPCDALLDERVRGIAVRSGLISSDLAARRTPCTRPHSREPRQTPSARSRC